MIDQLFLIIGLTLLVMISPGPDMVIVLRNTLIAGKIAGLKTSLGVLAGNLVHISYCILGIGWLISQSILAFNLLKYASAIYLIYLGVVSFRAEPISLETGAHEGPKQGLAQAWFLHGFINNVLNPKGTLFYLGVFTMVITPDTTQAVMALSVACMMLISTVFWLVFVYTIDRPVIRNLIKRFQITVNRLFGALLIFMGIQVAIIERQQDSVLIPE